MKQKVFLTSLYFFIPLYAPKKCYKEGFNELIANPFNANECDSAIRYKEIDSKDNTKSFLLIPSGEDNVEFSIRIKKYILRHPVNNGKRYRYILAIGTDIDQSLYQTQKNTNVLCEERLLVLLKQAFLCQANANPNHPMLLTDDAGRIPFIQWLQKEFLPEIENIYRNTIHLKYSITDVRCAQVDEKDVNNEDAFSKAYFEGGLNTIESTFGDQYNNFAYGLLYSYPDYNNLRNETLNEFLSPFIPEEETTRLFSSNGSLVCFHSHGQDRERVRFVRNHFYFSQLPNIYEICLALLEDTRLRLYQSKLKECKTSNAIRRYFLKMSVDTNRIPSTRLDDKKHHIFQTWRLYERQQDIQKEGKIYSQILDSKTNRRYNRYTIALSVYMVFLSIITYIITYNSIKFGKSMGSQIHCNCREVVSSTMQEPLLGVSENTLFALFCVFVMGFLLLLIVLELWGIWQRKELKELMQKWHDGN